MPKIIRESKDKEGFLLLHHEPLGVREHFDAFPDEIIFEQKDIVVIKCFLSQLPGTTLVVYFVLHAVDKGLQFGQHKTEVAAIAKAKKVAKERAAA